MFLTRWYLSALSANDVYISAEYRIHLPADWLDSYTNLCPWLPESKLGDGDRYCQRPGAGRSVCLEALPVRQRLAKKTIKPRSIDNVLK